MASVTLEEYELLGDAKYRSYVSAIDKVLKNFEYTSEWADLISALGKLNKVLLNHLKYPVIPRRIVISKRLAQCMHPALPSGVHLKALETYDIVFKCIGTNRLSQELFIYSAGLFPLLGNAAMNVRPALLNIYENHFVPLAERLRPGLSGFLTGVLSGLEEGSEYHERTNVLLEKVCDGVQPNFFYGCLWECVLTNPSVRLPAILFVMAHFNKKQSMEDQLYIVGTNVDILVQALCAAVQDSSVLVQRSALDLLLLGFPMHNSQLIRSDMERIQTLAVGVVLRRDMSLNRRLYAWLLGTEVNTAYLPTAEKTRSNSVASSESGNINPYFDTYSRDLLVQALRTCLKGQKGVWQSSSSPDVRPYRMLISLLDKPEIGSAILDDVLVEVFRSLYHECSDHKNEHLDTDCKPHLLSRACSKANKPVATGKNYSELLKTANLLFGTLEPYYIWEYVGGLFTRACARACSGDSAAAAEGDKVVKGVGEGSPSVLEICQLIEFLLEVVTIETYVEIQTEHLPELLRNLVTSLSTHCNILSARELTFSLRLCLRILTKVQPPPMPAGSNDDKSIKSACGSRDSRETLTPDHFAETPTEERKPFSPTLSETGAAGEVDDEFEMVMTSVSPEVPLHQPCAQNNVDSNPDLNRPEVDLQSAAENSLRRTLVHSCVQVFEDFFVQFMLKRVFVERTCYEEAFKQLVIGREESESERKRRLEQMLRICMDGSDVEITSAASPTFSSSSSSASSSTFSSSSMSRRHKNLSSICDQTRPNVQVEIVSSVSELTQAFSYACQMLVEFSSFPMYCSQNQCPSGNRRASDLYYTIPDWLQVLMVTAANVREIELQLVSVATLLDLITITRSVAREQASKSRPPLSPDWAEPSSLGTVAVVIVPLVEVTHLEYLDNSTCFYQVVATQLWEQLGHQSLCYHRRIAELLHQLHSLAPNETLVEDVIGNSMAHDDELLQVEAFRRFAMFWHLIRDLPTKISSVGNVRMYDRCLFVMLDCLHQEVGPQRIEVQSWLTHSLQRGDTARLLEPLLFVLLHPDTARVSVQHVNIQKPCKVRLAENEDEGSSTEAKIYAISSVEGHIFYHVSDEPRQTTAVNGSRNPRRVFALTSLAGESSSQVVTANACVTDFDLPSSHERGVRAPILLFINPIGGVAWNEEHESSSSMPDLSHARRIDTSSFRQELCFDDVDTSETKASTPEEVKELTSTEVVEGILDDLISSVVYSEAALSNAGDDVVLEEGVSTKSSDLQISQEANFSIPGKPVSEADDVSVHPLHTHLLLYWQVYDSKRVLYALNLLYSIVQANPRLSLCTLSSCSLSSARSPRHGLLHNLLARHRRSMFGKGFHGVLPAEAVTAFRSNMLLEILISVSLYFVRSFYPNLAQMRLTEEELGGNREVQLAAVELLNLLLSELIPIVKSSARGFSSYIADVLSRCRVQKTVMHCLLSNVYASNKHKPEKTTHSRTETSGQTFTEAILDFNEVPKGTQLEEALRERTSDYSESFQVCVLRLLLMLIILEDHVVGQKSSSVERDAGKAEGGGERPRSASGQQNSTVRYQQGVSIPSQPMFITAVVCALKQKHKRHLHRHWLALVTSALPFLGRSLSHIVITIINQLCHNLEMLATQYKQTPGNGTVPSAASGGAPVDYVMTLLDGLTTLCHYCVLDSSSQLSTVLTQPHVMSIQNPLMAGPNAGQIISNLINVFTPSTIQKDLNSSRDTVPPIDPLIFARRSLLSQLPRIVSALSTMWLAMQVAEKSVGQQHPCWIMGTPKAVKQRILEFLSPITHHHGLNFMAAIAVVWTEKRKKGPINTKRVIPMTSEEQLVLVNLVSAIKVMPMDTLVQTVRQVIKQPPSTNSPAVKAIPLEVSMLQFFYSYVQMMAGGVLLESWASLLGLLKEGLQLGLVPSAQFLLLGILNEFVQNAQMLDDKKDQKDLQDIAQKLIEAVSSVAGACLEQTTWLRRSLAVRPGPQPDIPDSDSELDDSFGRTNSVDEEPNNHGVPRQKSSESLVPSSDASQYSVQALSILAELLAPLLDVIYVSDEKEKVVPLLNNIMYNVTPYLRNHSQHNIPSYRACSVLLSSLSGYQYTRKAWRRDALELLLDANFFQMTEVCLGYWQITVDNLMTHDRSTFRDLMARVSMTQSGSLNLFSTKEQEWEQRAQLLKRVAFVIFSGEVDQYQNFMPDIQERLSESLRMPQVPSVQSQVFLCFRVLLLRMSPQHITSLWPIIITEMVQVFLQMEQELNTDSEEFSSHLRRLSTLDSAWVVSSNNGLNAHNHPAWLQLYLAVCKLLDLALALPADRLPQFQMYRWAFVGECGDPAVNNNNNKDEAGEKKKPIAGLHPGGCLSSLGFVPHITRLAQLLNKKVTSQEKMSFRRGHPLLNVTSIKSVLHLQPFFNTLVTVSQSQPPSTLSAGQSSVVYGSYSRQPSDDAGDATTSSIRHRGTLLYIEKIVQRDFLETLTQT